VLSCSYMVEAVRHAMGDGADWGVRLRYAVETEPLGTGGGVRNAVDLMGEPPPTAGRADMEIGPSGARGEPEPKARRADTEMGPSRARLGGLVVVLNGDVLTDADLGAMLRFHAERRARATIYLVPVPDPTPYGLVELEADGRVRRFTEKPDPSQITTNTINAGFYIIDRALVARMPAGRVVSIEREFFPGLLADAVPFFGWVGEHYWLDIGSPAKYRQGQLDLLAGTLRAPVAPAFAAARPSSEEGGRVMSPSVIGAGSRLAPGSRVGPRSVLGRACAVGPDAVVEGSMLWDRVDVGAGAVLRDCIVASGVRIGAGAVVGPGVVLADGAVVPEAAVLCG
jgi:mannose-1-phosphate guanylyltransferase